MIETPGREADEIAAHRPRRRAPGSFARLGGLARRLFSARLDKSAGRIRFIALAMAVAYLGIGVKLVSLGVSHDPPQTLKVAADQAVSGARPDLLDRNGEILATDVKTMSVFAEPRRIIDKDEAVELITAVLPDVDAKELRERLGSKKGFVWVKRQVTAKEQEEIFHLGLPGVGFLPENKRVYPNGPIGAHVIGFVDTDNIGIAGMEKYLDQQSLTDPHVAGFTVDPDALKPVRLSLDLRATHALRDELVAGMAALQGQGGRRGDPRRHHRRGHRTGIIARFRSERSRRLHQGPDADQPPQRRRLRDGFDFQGAVAGDGARLGQGHAQFAHRRPRKLALRTLHHPRFPRHPSRSHRAGSLHPFLQHRRRADGADGGRRGPPGVPERRWVSSIGCAPSCRKAPSRWCPSTGASSTR